MRRLSAIPIVAAALLALAPAAPQQQKGVSTQTIKGYLDKMEMPSVPHPKSVDTLVVPRTGNANTDRIDLYVERRTDQTLVLTAYPKFKGRYFNLSRVADREKLFLPYYSTKRRGSGLGLAIVRRIIAEHGGTIDVGANVPKGTRFTIELPC